MLRARSFACAVSEYQGQLSVQNRKESIWYIGLPEEKWHNSKLPFFRRSSLIIIFFLILVFKIEESETANTYVGKNGIPHT
jgi:hypothetical protein